MIMNTFALLLLVAVAVLGSNAVPLTHRIAAPRIGGGAAQATVLHAVLVVVIREDHDANVGALGGGSIVSRNRVITAAHVVAGSTEVQVGFYINRVAAANFRRVDATYVQAITGFDPDTLANDLAVLHFEGTPFGLSNVIPLTNAATHTGAAVLAGYGFTSSDVKRPSLLPLLAAHTIVATCEEELNATPSHFCATAGATGFVCPGDNGSGLYTLTTTNTVNNLIGLVSTIHETCDEARQSAFTNLGAPNVQAFLRSQGITIPAAA